MPIHQIGRKTLPKYITQTTLNNFFNNLPPLSSQNVLIYHPLGLAESKSLGYSYEITAENTIEIQETHCLNCGKRLVKNGFNARGCVLDAGEGYYHFRLHRKRCKRCGEVIIDLSALAAAHAKYHENYRRKARQHYMRGLMPSQIQWVFSIDYNTWISRSTLVRWINFPAETLNQVMRETIVPSSGYWGYDEIFLRISHTRQYSLNLYDLHTNFCIFTAINSGLTRGNGVVLLRNARRNAQLPIFGIVKDGGMIFGNLFQMQRYSNVKVSYCHTHLKWNVNRYLKQAAGLPKESKKPLPERFLPIQAQYYSVIDSKTDTDAYLAIEGARSLANWMNNKYLQKGVETLESALPMLISCQSDPNLDNTNNQIEGFHRKLEYYPSFKRNMRTVEGCTRVANYRNFLHNFEQFLPYYARLLVQFQTYIGLGTKKSLTKEVISQHPYYLAKFRQVQSQYNSYFAFYQQFLQIR